MARMVQCIYLKKEAEGLVDRVSGAVREKVGKAEREISRDVSRDEDEQKDE